MQIVLKFYRAILDTLPLPVFLIDEQMRVYGLNDTAGKLFNFDGEIAFLRRFGDTFHCLNVNDSQNSCVSGEHCRDCSIRASVQACFAGKKIHRQRAKLRTLKAGVSRDLDVLLTAASLPSEQGRLVLLLSEDVTELTLLKRLVPICMHCKKVRDDQQDWRHLENFFRQCIGVDFSHGVCPDCLKQHYSDL